MAVNPYLTDRALISDDESSDSESEGPPPMEESEEESMEFDIDELDIDMGHSLYPTMPQIETFASRVLRSGVVPKKLMTIILVLLGTIGHPTCRVMSVELFAGVHSVTHAFKAYDYPAQSLDFNTVSPNDDLNSSGGFLRALTYVLGLQPDGPQTKHTKTFIFWNLRPATLDFCGDLKAFINSNTSTHICFCSSSPLNMGPRSKVFVPL